MKLTLKLSERIYDRQVVLMTSISQIAVKSEIAGKAYITGLNLPIQSTTHR